MGPSSTEVGRSTLTNESGDAVGGPPHDEVVSRSRFSKPWMFLCRWGDSTPVVPFEQIASSDPLLQRPSRFIMALFDRAFKIFAKALWTGSLEDAAESNARLSCHMVFVVVASVLLAILYYFQIFASAVGSEEPLNLDCYSSFSKYSTVPFGASRCGLNAINCNPSPWISVRCNGWCLQSQKSRENSHLIFKVIGNGPYRADSTICAAAIHGGLIADGGGCFDVRIVASNRTFEGSIRNGIRSLTFDSWFPLSLELRSAMNARRCSYGGWWGLLVVHLVALFSLSLLRPQRLLFFWYFLILLFWYSALISQMHGHYMVSLMTLLGRFIYFVFVAHVIIWKVGAAETFFTDTRADSAFQVLLLEILPAFMLSHWHMLSWYAGHYSLVASTFRSTRGVALYCIVFGALLPIVAYLLRAWHRAGLLCMFACRTLKGCCVIILLTILFETKGWGLHLHHYFIGAVCYLGSRGPSRVAIVVRAVCLGVFVEGLATWGDPAGIPIWSEGEGALGLTRKANVKSSGNMSSSVVWTSVDLLGGAGGGVHLSWALISDLERSSCSLPVVSTASEGSVFVVEMNHVEVYRGSNRSWTFRFPSTSRDARRFYFKVGEVQTSFLTSAVVSSTPVLPVRTLWPPVENYPDPGANACERAAAFLRQPTSSVENFV
eukprot:TRINITY_DN75533_c0_g1_i1.p1 TRINITY_DN75533_c0_g1~~TRINITY_DN75533_c0_g1_i1.p1  ORF type:complete len:661 (-),score=36.56 TRINITY_DN75533_c0_g1_i1:3-1985(-)